MTDSSAQTKGKFRAWHMGVILFGAFLVVASVNGVFIYYALSSWTGLTEKDAYAKGVAYNDELDRRAAQEAIGWRASLTVTPSEDGLHRIVLTLKTAEGAPVTGATARADIRRPTQEALDVTAEFAETAPGSYAASVTLPAQGQWDILVEAERGEETFKAAKRINLR